MQPTKPIYTIELFPTLHGYLIELLQSLTSEDWQRLTSCKGWSVKDIASHLLDGHLRRIAIYRDHYFPSTTLAINSYQTLVGYLNQLNQDWVIATRRLSPAQLIEWLEQAGPQVYQLFKELPPFGQAIHSVAWAGEQTSFNWFHIAREYTELWHHQQQIRLALTQTEPLMRAELHYPLVDTFIRALPHTYQDIPAPISTLVKFTITELSGAWYLYRVKGGWQLVTGVDELAANTEVKIDGQIAWRLFTKGLSASEVSPYIAIKGDQSLGTPVLGMTSVMA